jgi:hypothetical protein
MRCRPDCMPGCNYRYAPSAHKPSAVNLKFLSLLAASLFRNSKFKTALES